MDEETIYRRYEEEMVRRVVSMSTTELKMHLGLLRPVTGNIDAIMKCRELFNRG